MFETILDLMPRDPDYPPRTRTLDVLRRVLDGRFYDVLPYQFHEERGAGGEYIPLRNRRPSVRYALSRVVVEDSVSLLFSEGHFPTIDCADSVVRDAFADLVKESRLNLIMTDAAIRGSIGSVAVLMRVLHGRVFFNVLDTLFLQPSWDPNEPDTLAGVTERYKVPGTLLATNGYDIDDPALDHWFMRTWDQQSETWFLPIPTDSDSAPLIDQARSVQHGLGFVGSSPSQVEASISSLPAMR
jgi:hypothetical protein